MSTEAINKQIPSIRPTQFEDDGNDLFKDSVNLFRGDVNLSLNLVSLQGRNGLDFKVTASYGSNVKNNIQISNVDKPTGIMGLGWTLPFQRIEVETSGNATSNDNTYFIYNDNTPTELIRSNKVWERATLDTSLLEELQTNAISGKFQQSFQQSGLPLSKTATVSKLTENTWHISDAKRQRTYHAQKNDNTLVITAAGLSFECFQYDFSQIIYYPEFESWEVIKDDGTMYTYGGKYDASENRNVLQYNVRWHNWKGTTNVVDSEQGESLQSQFIRGWNLATVENIFGDQIQFYYEAVMQKVGETGLTFTKASYISKITDMFSREVLFQYKEKAYVINDPAGAREYMDPHWNDPYGTVPTTDPSPYQDQYETKYLDAVVVQNDEGTILYTQQLTYDETSNFSDYQKSSNLYGNTVKRTLTGVQKIFGNGSAKPGLLLAYWQAGSVNAGALKSAITPEGAEISYQYKKQELAKCDRQITVENPWPGVGTPKVWYGSDFVFNTWQNTAKGQLKVALYTWVGRWQVWEPEEPIFSAKADIDSLNAVTTQDFVCFHYASVQNSTSEVRVYHKNNRKWGDWFALAPISLKSANIEVVAGDNFFLVCDQDNRTLLRYTWNAFTKAWIIEDISDELQSGNPNAVPYLVASNKYYAILDYNPLTGGEHHNDFSLYYQEDVYKWKAGASTTLTFTIGGKDPNEMFGFTASPSSIALTYITKEVSLRFDYTVKLIQWDEVFQNLQITDVDYQLGKSNPSQAITVPFTARIIANSMVASGPYLLRYNGEKWLQNDNLSYRKEYNDKDINWFAYGNDYAIYTSNREFAADSKLLSFDPTINSFEWTNEPAVLLEKQGSTSNRKIHYFPTAATNIATMGSNVYNRESQTNWQNAVNTHEELPKDINSTTMINQGPQFLTYLNTDANGYAKNSSVWTLQNQFLHHEEIIAQRFFTPIDSQGMINRNTNGQYPAGPSTFVTSLPLNKEFKDAESITIHRYLEGTIQGKVVDYCVDTMSRNTGYETNVTKYVFDLNSATCDPSGAVVKYYKSLYYPGTDTIENPEFGHVENIYYNDLVLNSIANKSINLKTTMIDTEASSLLDGQLINRRTYDKAGKVLTEEISGLQTFTQITQDGVQIDLFGGFVRSKSETTINDGLQKTTRYTYDPTYGKLILEEYDNINGEGNTETLRTHYAYAYQAYPWFLKRNAIDISLAQFNSVIPSGATAEVCTAGSLQTYAPTTVTFPDNTEKPVWCTSKSYVLKEELNISNFIDNLPASIETTESYWQLVNTVLKRTPFGVICQEKDVSGKVETSFFDKDEIHKVASFVNAGTNQSFYTGFESYESYQQDWKLSGTTQNFSDALLEGDAFTGYTSLQITAGTTLTKNSETEPQERCILSSWVKLEKGFLADEGSAFWELTTAKGTQKVDITVDEEEKWIYWQTVVTTDDEKLSLALVNAKTQKSIAINNITFTPVVGQVSINVFNAYRIEIAKVGANADVTRYAYDPLHDKIAEIGPAENTKSASLIYRIRQWDTATDFKFPQNGPNSVCQLAASKGGLYETFTDGAQIWEQWVPETAASWSTEQGNLVYKGSEKDTITWAETKDQENYALLFSLLVKDVQNSMFEISIGETVKTAWAASTGWTLTLDGKTVENTTDKKAPLNVCLLPIGNTFYVFADGKQLFAEKSSTTLSGTMKLTAQGEITFADMATYQTPQASMAYKNGNAKDIQLQVIGDEHCLVREKIYNSLSSQTIETKITGFADTAFGYRPNFVTDINWTTGVMTGEVSDYYPEDEGYPYSRTLFEASPLKRPIKSGLPGKDFAITETNIHVGVYRYGIEDQARIAGIDFVKGNYLVNLVMDSDGAKVYELKDRSRNVLAKQTGSTDETTAIISATQQVYDYKGNLVQVLPPNYFGMKSDQEDYTIHKSYNFLSQMTQVTTTDSGTTKFVYDPSGQARFSINALNETVGTVAYKKYDVLGRITEEGTIPGTWGDGSEWQKLANTDPNYPTVDTWSKLNEYDGDGSNPTLIGRLWKTISQSDAKKVTNGYEYNIYGNAIVSTLLIEGATEQKTSYEYDNLGNVLAVQYPENSPVPKVTYQYNILGQNTAIGTPEVTDQFAKYSYNADGSIASETFNPTETKAIQRKLQYNSPGWITEILNQFSEEDPILKLGYSYTSGGYDDAKYFNGSIANAATTNYIKAENSFDYRFKYNNVGQLVVAEHSSNANYNLGVITPTTYDPNGNIETITSQDETLQYTYDAGTNKVLQVNSVSKKIDRAYGYDTYGNIIKSTANNIEKIAYDSLTNLPLTIKLNSGIVQSYKYNGLQQRVVKSTSDGQQKTYVHGLNDLPLAEISGELVQYIHGVGGLIGMLTSDGMFYMLKDQQGSVRSVVNATGTVEAMIDYLPFGQIMANSYGDPSRFTYLFTGQEFEASIQLYNYRARMYDPQLCRFYSTDPQFQYGSPYVYANNNPVNLSDPSGEIATLLVILIVGAAVGAAVGAGAAAYTGIKAGLSGGALAGYIFAGAGIGAVAGALSAAGGVGAFAAGSAAAAAATTTTGGIIAGVAAGAGVGAAVGAAVGGAQSVSQYFVNDAFGVQNSGSWQNALLKGSITGAVGGAIAGGIAGGGGALATIQSLRFQQLGNTNLTYNYKSLTQVSEAYSSFGSMGVIPLPSFVSKVPNVSVPIIGGLQTFVLGKFALPTLGSGVAALTKEAVNALFFSSSQTADTKNANSSTGNTPTTSNSSDYYGTQSYNPTMQGSVGSQVALFLNPSYWKATEG
ncbi:MAG: RHS repeat-associated core domain-containing protein [Bacteroidota bacterium]